MAVKKMTVVFVSCLLLVLAAAAFLLVRKGHYDYGREQGYLMGYAMGYADRNGTVKQNGQELAGRAAPFAVGSSRWKGFMIGFPEGYSAGCKEDTWSKALDVTVSYANWTDAAEIRLSALNFDKMIISSVPHSHLPIYKFDTREDLERFKRTFDGVLSMNACYDEVPSFHDATAKYDKAFFEENTLMLVYVTAYSGSYRFGVNSVSLDGGSFCIYVEQTNDPEVGTQDMAGWFITVAVPDSTVAGCTGFDAVLKA